MSSLNRVRCSITGAAALAMCGGVLADVRISEYMYSGANGEFIEITNTGSTAIDLTGWSFDDSARVPGTFPIGSIGVLAPGQSAIITESGEAAFRAAWSLAASVPVVPDLARPYGNNFGRNDTIVLYNAALEIVDRLDYGDQTFPGSIRTNNPSGWVNDAGLGANNPYAWGFSSLGDAQSSYDSSLGARGNPGHHVIAGTVPRGVSMTLTEYMYDGPGGEFVEFTNLSNAAIDMTGWQLDDSNLLGGPNGPFDVSAFGTVAPGESIIVTEANADAFRLDWNLPATVKIIGDLGKGNGNGLGRNDEINIYDANGALVDRLTYGDQAFPGSIRTQNASGWIPPSELGTNNALAWVLATLADAQNSVVSVGGDIGNPGVYPDPTPGIPGDLNGDRVVDGFDLAIVLGAWGKCPLEGDCVGDVDGDGIVSGTDIAIILGYWT